MDNFEVGEAVDMGFKAPMASAGAGFAIKSTFRGSVAILLFMEAVFICIFGACTKVTTHPTFTNLYYFYTGVAIMIFFGFGYLMTFLKRYGMGAVGFTMLLTVVAIQWGILVEAFFHQLYYIEDHPWHFIHIDIFVVMDSLFIAGGIMISFGAVIGKASPFQLLIMAISEAFFFALNKRLLCLGVVEFVDAGGSINIHMFGAYFGLAVAWWLGKPATSAEAEGGHISDLFSLIGTLFLWIYWPSFNAGPLPAESPQQQRAVVNTILCLTFCVTSTFLTSSMLSSTFKFRPVDVQNATVAGGVAIGAVADFTLSGSDIALIGVAVGLLSTFGFARVQEWLEHKFSIHDTCGVHNLHAMPSLLGAVISIIVTAVKSQRDHDYPPMLNEHQALDQFLAVVFTLGISISSGFITGWLMSRFSPSKSIEAYSDTPWWDVMDDFGRSIEDTEEELEQKLKDSLLELQAGLKTAEELRTMMSRYEQMGDNENYDSSDDSDDDGDDNNEDLTTKLSNLVPARHKASTMFGAGHAKSSMTSSRHQGGGFTGQRALNSSIHGGGRAAIMKQSMNSSRHSGMSNVSFHSSVSK